MRVARRHVRGVGNDQIETLAAKRVEPVALHELHVVHGVAPRIFARDVQGRGGEFGRDKSRARPMSRDRHGNASAAGPEIERAARSIGVHTLERELDEQFGFGPRDQDGGGDLERKAVELAFSGEVGNRLPGAPAFHERKVAIALMIR